MVLIQPVHPQCDILCFISFALVWPWLGRVSSILGFCKLRAIYRVLKPPFIIGDYGLLFTINNLSLFSFKPLVHFNFTLQPVAVCNMDTKLHVHDSFLILCLALCMHKPIVVFLSREVNINYSQFFLGLRNE